MDDPERGSGRTTQQMKEAPLGAIYIWLHGEVWYPKNLAAKIGRADLQIVGPMWLNSMNFQGKRLSGIVIDHATYLSDKQWKLLDIARTSVGR